jgi:WD40 repeat protein
MALPRSLDMFENKLLVGQANAVIGEFTLDAQLQPTGVTATNPNGLDRHIEGHYDGEAWGCAMIQDEGANMYITCGDDNTLLLHDIKLKRVVGRGAVDVKGKSIKLPKPAFVRGGASTMSKHHVSQQARGIVYDTKLNHLAIGTNEGLVSIRSITDLQEYTKTQKKVSLDNELVVLKTGCVKPKIAAEWIEELVYSPDSATLAVGSHDNRIYLYTTGATAADYKLKARCDGHSSYITTIDFTADNNWIRTTCGAYELLFFNNADTKGGRNTNVGGGASATTGNVWAGNHAKFGWRVDGIYPEGTDGTYVNSVDFTLDDTTIATGTDNGISLYRNPCRSTNHKNKCLRGHSEFVCRVRFAHDTATKETTHLISIGG